MATTRRKKKPTLAKMLQSLDRDEYQAFVQHLIEQDKVQHDAQRPAMGEELGQVLNA
jgi:hypothetical protein